MKVGCKTCGAQILRTTAADNDGKCVPCAKGYRANIESSKKFYAEQKKYDPDRALWQSLLAKDTRRGFGQFSDDEKLYFAVTLLDGEVHNGGFHQYFFNSSGDHFEEALRGFEALNASQCKAIAAEAAYAVFGRSQFPKDRAERMRAVLAFDERIDPENDPLDVLDKRFYSDPDDLTSLLMSFARTTDLIQPFLEERQGK